MIVKRILNKIGIKMYYRRNYNGVTFKIPFFNGLGYANFSGAESWMDHLLKKIGNDEMKILDIGVNVGQTLLKWKSIFPNSSYVGIEPNVGCAYYVNHLIEKNNIQNAYVIPVAMSNKSGIGYLYRSTTDPSDIAATIVENFREEQGKKITPIVTLPFDVFVQEKFDIIKIDVEGAESEVIQSIFNSTLNNKPIITCEILPVYEKENEDRLNRQKVIENILHENNYFMYRIIHTNKKIELIPIDEIGIHGNMSLCEYLFVHSNIKNDIVSRFE